MASLRRKKRRSSLKWAWGFYFQICNNFPVRERLIFFCLTAVIKMKQCWNYEVRVGTSHLASCCMGRMLLFPFSAHFFSFGPQHSLYVSHSVKNRKWTEDLRQHVDPHEIHLPMTFLHLLQSLWKIFIECLWKEEVHHTGGNSETSHKNIRQNLIISTWK